MRGCSASKFAFRETQPGEEVSESGSERCEPLHVPKIYFRLNCKHLKPYHFFQASAYCDDVIL